MVFCFSKSKVQSQGAKIRRKVKAPKPQNLTNLQFLKNIQLVENIFNHLRNISNIFQISDIFFNTGRKLRAQS